MKIHHYTAVFQKEPTGGYTVIVPSLPGCVTWGKTTEDAIAAGKKRSNHIWEVWQKINKHLPLISVLFRPSTFPRR